MFRACDLADKGTWPETGGWLHQTEACVDGVQLCRNIDAAYKAKLQVKPNE